MWERTFLLVLISVLPCTRHINHRYVQINEHTQRKEGDLCMGGGMTFPSELFYLSSMNKKG